MTSRKEYKAMELKSPKEILVRSFFHSIQKQILQKAINIKPDCILAETSPVGYFSLMAKNNLNIPLITDVHGLMGEESKIQGSRYTQIMSNVEINAFLGSDYLLAVSNPMKRQICLKYGVREDQILVVPNGGNIQPFQSHFDLPLKVIFAGNFAVYERISDYLDIAKALEHNSSFAFFLMGDGIQKRDLLKRIRKENIPIKFLGLKTKEEALHFFSKMQVGVLTSTSGLEREVAFPIKMLDYMSCGLPVIAPKIGEWGELIEKENCGIAVEKNTIAEFITALFSLCDKQEWEKKSLNAKKCIERKYNWDAVLSPLDILIENMTI